MSRFRRRQTVVCQQLVELVTDYLEGDLDPQLRNAVEAHLADCGHCRGYVEQVRRMLTLTAMPADPTEVPPRLLEELVGLYRRRS